VSRETSKATPSKTNASSAASPETPAAVGQAGGRTATIRYLDRPDLEETFADSLTGLTFDGQTLRIEFGVTRLDEVKAEAPLSGRRHPACRLVLTPGAAVDLINRMQQIAAALKQAGVIKGPPQSV
jgi:hypothetical protein